MLRRCVGVGVYNDDEDEDEGGVFIDMMKKMTKWLCVYYDDKEEGGSVFIMMISRVVCLF